MKVLLLQPLVTKEKLWGKYAIEGGSIPPIGLLTIASYLESKGYHVKIVDPLVDRLDKNKLGKFLKKNNFDLIGIPAFTNTVVDTYKTVNFCKELSPKSKIIVGGVHATVLPIRTMEECPNIDFLAVGEGEFTTEELLKYLKKGNPTLKKIKGLVFRGKDGRIIVNEKRGLIDVDLLPLPAYHLLDMSKYIPHPTQYRVLPNYPVIFQRGCPFSCAFCSAHCVHGRTIRHKSIDNLIKEIELLIKRYGTKGIYFQDSTFTVNRHYVSQLCKEIIRKGLKFQWAINTRVDCLDRRLLFLMKKAGLWLITFGLESGNQTSLDLLNKQITLPQIEKAIKMTREQGIVTLSSWILGLPGENERMVKKTIQFAKHVGTELVLFYLPIPYPGTDLVALCQKDGGLRNDAKWEDYHGLDFSNPVYVNPLLGKKKMQQLLKYANLSYYFSPKILWRNLRAIKNWNDVRVYWRGIRAFIYSLVVG